MTEAVQPAYPHLFTPGRIGDVEIRNRIVQSPMGTGLIEMGRVTDREVALQEERARGGVGLIVTGGTGVHETSRFPARILLEAWDEGGIAMMRRRCDAVHRHGARIFGQLVHLGRESPGGQTDMVPMGPSPIPQPRDPAPPHQMSHVEIRTIVEAFGRSAANMKAAGYDGVEIHAAHGYLVAQFLSPASNGRTDEYRGDTLDGRLRLLVEVIEEMRSRCGDDYPVGVRLSGDEGTADGMTIDDTLEIVDALQEAAPADYLSITHGMRGSYVKDSTYDEGFALPLAEPVKQIVDVPVIVAGRFRHPGLAEQALAAGRADFIAFGRAMLVDPEWATKAREGRESEIRPCLGFVQDCRRTEAHVACAVNARLGRELEWGRPVRAAEARRVVVAGGGPGGLEAARVAAEAGHHVVLYEQTDELGGQLRIAAAGPTREELLEFVFYSERELGRLGVDVRLGATATREAVLADEPDLVVGATGATPLAPEFTVGAGASVVTVWDLLGGAVRDIPARAAVVDDGSGFWHGVSAAEYLAERGAAVELITPARGVALAIPHESASNVYRRLRDNGVRFRPFSTVTAVNGSTIALADSVNGAPSETEADLVVVRTRMRVNDELMRELDGAGPALALVGDCASPRRLTHAVLDANVALRRFAEGRLGREATIVF
jgi:2,4-dienoyl-CoA reductase-like NADH-dependent reductase (Old Yellow Enzyme family)